MKNKFVINKLNQHLGIRVKNWVKRKTSPKTRISGKQIHSLHR